MIKLLTQDLHDVFSYNPSTGDIKRKIRLGNYQAGTLCSSRSTNGKYYKVTYAGQQHSAHRLAWFLHYNEQPPDVIDHIDGNGHNNAINNLRASTTSQNQMNIGVTVKSKTGVKGIMSIRNGTLYRAEICVGGVRYQKHSKSIAVLADWLAQQRPILHGQFQRAS